MTALPRRLLFIAVLGVAVLGVVVILAMDSPPHSSLSAPGDASQSQYQVDVETDRSSLTSGYAGVPRKVRVDVDQTLRFAVTLCGDKADSQDRRCRRDAPRPDGPTVEPQPVGARVRARLTTDATAEIVAVSSEIQPVIQPTDSATWTWNVKPSKSGTYTLMVVLTTLRGGTEEALLADRILASEFEVGGTFAHSGSVFARIVKDYWPVITGVVALPFIPRLAKRFQKWRKAKAASWADKATAGDQR